MGRLTKPVQPEEPEDDEGPKSDVEPDDEGGLDLDAALNDRTNKRANEYLDPWTKDGITCTWLHTATKFHKVVFHKWFEIITYGKRGEEKSFIKRPRFNCHESADYAIKPNDDRDDDLRRKSHPMVCPFCKMIAWVEEELISGRMSPSQELFRFDDGNPKNLVSIHAGGISGLITLDSAPTRWKKQCKNDRVLQYQPWNENLYAKISILFQVVADANPNSVVYAFEPTKLYQQLMKEVKKQKIEHGDDKGNPQKHPYALVWQFDEKVAYRQGYEVTATRTRPLTNKIRKLINGPLREDLKEKLAFGNCLELRASFENALVDGVDMPFDEIFGAAKKAGLMTKAASSAKTSKKDDDEDDEPQSEPKPKTSSKLAPVQAKGKPTPEEPDDDDDGDDDGDDDDEPADTCDICHSEVGPDDTECNECETTFDDDYEVSGIKCKKDGCDSIVPLNNQSDDGDDTLHICEKCATVHRLAPSVRTYYDAQKEANKTGKRCDLKLVWTVEPEKQKTSEKPAREGRTGRRNVGGTSTRDKTKSNSDKLDKKLGKDPIPF